MKPHLAIINFPPLNLHSESNHLKRLYPIPQACLHDLKREEETGIGYQVISVQLEDGACFDQVVVSEGCVIEVRAPLMHMKNTVKFQKVHAGLMAKKSTAVILDFHDAPVHNHAVFVSRSN